MALVIDKQIEELNELIRWDIDAIGAYTEAISAIKEPPIRESLTRFREDHERHIDELSSIVRRLDGTPPTATDLKGIARKTMTKVAGLMGTETVLKAMQNNERAIGSAYSRHLTFDFPGDVLEVLKRNYQDEQRHLAYIDQALRARSWEQPGAHV
jgi:uncharacterized protein (TIGR02284 family)